MPFGLGPYQRQLRHTAPHDYCFAMAVRMHRQPVPNTSCVTLNTQTLRVHVSRHLHAQLAVVHNRRAGQGAPLPGVDIGGR